MKRISTILAVSILALFFSSQISASGYGGKTGFGENVNINMAKAIEHAEMAKAHGNDAKEILKYAETSLMYAQDAATKAIDNINVTGVEHIDASIRHLEEAIEYVKLGHADVASKHIDAALDEMHAYTAKKVDYLNDN